MTKESCVPKKALVQALKGIVDDLDRNDPCRECCAASEIEPPKCTPACAPAPKAPPRSTCRLRGKAVPPLISEPDYRKRGFDDWKYVIPLPEPLQVRSREIIASNMYHGCLCSRRNGLQDQCRRWDCRGAPFCCKNNLCKNSGGRGCDGALCRKG